MRKPWDMVLDRPRSSTSSPRSNTSSRYADSGAYGSAERIELLARGAVYGQMLGISAELELL
jgi:hypothetical protein